MAVTDKEGHAFAFEWSCDCNDFAYCIAGLSTTESLVDDDAHLLSEGAVEFYGNRTWSTVFGVVD